MKVIPHPVFEVIEDNLEPLWRRAPPGSPLGWILDGEDEAGIPEEGDAYEALEAAPECAWALGWLAGTANALGMTRVELLDACDINVGKIKR